MSPEGAKPKVAGRQLGPPLFVMAFAASLVPPGNLRVVRAVNDHLAGEGDGKRVSRGIWILGNKARHHVVIIAKHGVLARRHGGSVLRGAAGAWAYD